MLYGQTEKGKISCVCGGEGGGRNTYLFDYLCILLIVCILYYCFDGGDGERNVGGNKNSGKTELEDLSENWRNYLTHSKMENFHSCKKKKNLKKKRFKCHKNLSALLPPTRTNPSPWTPNYI